jgi:hypothetical protein
MHSDTNASITKGDSSVWIVKGLKSANMVNEKVDAENVAERAYVSTIREKNIAKYAAHQSALTV